MKEKRATRSKKGASNRKRKRKFARARGARVMSDRSARESEREKWGEFQP